jgi:hypothetical protein
VTVTAYALGALPQCRRGRRRTAEASAAPRRPRCVRLPVLRRLNIDCRREVFASCVVRRPLVHLTVHGSACAWTWIRANVVRGLIIICVWLWCSFSGDLAGDIFLRHPTPHTDAHTQLQACTHDGGGKGGVRGAVARKTPTIALRTLAPFSRRASSQPAQRRRASRAPAGAAGQGCDL